MMTNEYKEKLDKGLQYQDFVYEQLYNIGISTVVYSSKIYQFKIGENKAGIEIKFDDRMKDTGNIYFEVAEKSNANNKDFVPSGIFRSDNTWLYVIGDYSIIYVFPKKLLQHIYNRQHYIKAGGRLVEIKTSKGFVLPVVYAEREVSAKTINCT